MSALTAAMRLVELGRFEEAAAALEPLAGPRGDGVIARFRRAECLSRMGRHDEAVAEARRAHADAPAAPATGLWLAQALAEAGRHDEAAAVEHPAAQREFLEPVAEGYRGLAKLVSAADGKASDRDAAVHAVLESRHAPLYSLALRLCERARIAAEPRAPDLPSVWYRQECRMEMEEAGVTEHPTPPAVSQGALARRSSASEALRWLRFHAACTDWTALIAEIRAASPDISDLAEVELETLLASGRVDEAAALADRLAKEAGKDASGELAIDLCRIAQLRGRAARPSEFQGFDDAKRRHGDAIAWLECVAALMEGRAEDARAAADRVSDPSHREYVEAALLRWANAGPVVN